MPCKLVSIGGGTGQSTLLRGLRPYLTAQKPGAEARVRWLDELTAITTATDDGGSSGRLRRQLHVPAPGDIRNCMVALADDTALMTRLFKYRFSGAGDLNGHSLGNLLLTALAHVNDDFVDGLRVAGEVLGIAGRVYPSTRDDVSLVAELANGRQVTGETAITAAQSGIRRVWLEPPQPAALPEVIEAIRNADVVTLGPGSLYTSILSNLLIPELAATLVESKAKKIFICNVVTEPGETDGYSVEDHVSAVWRCVPALKIDAVLTSTAVDSEKDRILPLGAYPVVNGGAQLFSTRRFSRTGNRTSIVARDLLDAKNPSKHDPEKLAGLIKSVVDHWAVGSLCAIRRAG